MKREAEHRHEGAWPRGWIRIALLLLLAVAAPLPLMAQRGHPPGRDRAQLERRVRARFSQMVREQLKLSDEQARRLGEIMDEMREERSALAREEQALRRRFEALMLEESRNEEEARALLERMRELRRKDAELFAREQDRLLKVLTPLQVLKFQGMRDQLNRRLRQMRGMRRPGGTTHE